MRYFKILYILLFPLNIEYDKIEEFIAKEHELVSLGGQAAAAAHSLNTPLSTIKIISQDLHDQFKDKKELKKDLEYYVIEVYRCPPTILKQQVNLLSHVLTR